MSVLAELLKPSRLTEVVDIGANPIDGTPPYRAMLAAGLCRVTGFEPQKAALAELQQKKGANERYLDYVVGDGAAHTLHICAGSGMTSLFEPDQVNLNLFRVLQPAAKVVATRKVVTRGLNDIAEIEHMDFLKIDVQGSELAVFQSGRAGKLASTVAIQTEVSFISLYRDQPTFGDIDVELRSQGFIPHCFAGIKKLPIAPCVINNDPWTPLNQLLEADVVYVRDFARPESMSEEQLKHLALIAHHCYKSFDLVLRCLRVLERRGALQSDAPRRYLESCPELVS